MAKVANNIWKMKTIKSKLFSSKEDEYSYFRIFLKLNILNNEGEISKVYIIRSQGYVD